jgi:dienelactone hydrolase/uncharacterized protein (DUF952 family)
MTTTSNIFHLITTQQWNQIASSSHYESESLQTEGFIHASTRGQLSDSAGRYFCGKPTVALEIDASGLDIRWEDAAIAAGSTGSARREQFPHIYQPIPRRSIVRVIDMTETAHALFEIHWPKDDALLGFARRSIELLGTMRHVFVGGEGPAIIVMHEVPGLHPGVLDFARRLNRAGFSTYLPSMFGTPGRAVTPSYIAQSFATVCISREFSVWASDQNSPMVEWMRGLAHLAHQERGGPGVGAIGMCLTGGFALGMMVDPVVVAPVLSQPSLPAGPLPAQRRSIGIDKATCQAVAQRAVQDDISVMGLRFTGDPLVSPQRFAALRDLLGDRFIAVDIDSKAGNAHGISRTAHSVLTMHFVDEPQHPTALALTRLLEFFAQRLKKSPL